MARYKLKLDLYSGRPLILQVEDPDPVSITSDDVINNSPVEGATDTAALTTLNNGLLAATALAQQADQKATAALGGVVYIQSHNFGTATPTQQALNDYALSLPHIDTLTEGLTVVNTYDNYEWRYQPIPGTNPQEFEWTNIGQATVNQATNNTPGVVQGSVAQFGVTVNADGTMTVNGIQEALAQKQDKLTATEVVLTLPVTAWDMVTKTQTISGLDFLDKAIDYALPLVTTQDNANNFAAATIVVVAKTSNSLTFSCAELPDNDVNVSIKYITGQITTSNEVVNNSSVEGENITDAINTLQDNFGLVAETLDAINRTIV